MWSAHDGAPRTAGSCAGRAPSPNAYAKRRRKELRAALSLAGVGADRLLQLDVPDQEAALSLCKLVHRLATLARAAAAPAGDPRLRGRAPRSRRRRSGARLAVERPNARRARRRRWRRCSPTTVRRRLVADRFLPASTDR